jgi:signal transduction histidine kinase
VSEPVIRSTGPGVVLGEVVQASLQAHDEEARLKHITFLIDVDLRLTAAVDADRLRAVLDRLVRNAVIFTQPGGWIRVTAQPERGEALVSVKDNGVGMPLETLKALFDSPMGGLTEVARTVRSYGGRLWANSKPGKGSTFYFTLPRA